MDGQIRLADLTDVAGPSRTHCVAQLRASVGMLLHEYLTTRRIQRTQRFLRDPRSSVVDVALSVGFQTQARFTRVFRSYVGDTPHHWRSARPFDDAAVLPSERLYVAWFRVKEPGGTGAAPGGVTEHCSYAAPTETAPV
jgi:AraC-like DNA-binding protein